jgi:hypothetical protein
MFIRVLLRQKMKVAFMPINGGLRVPLGDNPILVRCDVDILVGTGR